MEQRRPAGCHEPVEPLGSAPLHPHRPRPGQPSTPGERHWPPHRYAPNPCDPAHTSHNSGPRSGRPAQKPAATSSRLRTRSPFRQARQPRTRSGQSPHEPAESPLTVGARQYVQSRERAKLPPPCTPASPHPRPRPPPHPRPGKLPSHRPAPSPTGLPAPRRAAPCSGATSGLLQNSGEKEPLQAPPFLPPRKLTRASEYAQPGWLWDRLPALRSAQQHDHRRCTQCRRLRNPRHGTAPAGSANPGARA